MRLDLGNFLLLSRMSMPHSSQQFSVIPDVAGATAVLVVNIPSTEMNPYGSSMNSIIHSLFTHKVPTGLVRVPNPQIQRACAQSTAANNSSAKNI